MSAGPRVQESTSTTPEQDLSALSNVERLIFAQAVHEFGANAWAEVAKLLSNHPLITQPKGTFTAQSCPVLHRMMMEEAGLEWSETDVGPRSEKHLKLAQRYYVARVTELRALIANEEAKFKRLVAEIDEIRSGAWDDKIRASLGEEPVQSPSQDEVNVPEPAQPQTSEPPDTIEGPSSSTQTVPAEEDVPVPAEEPPPAAEDVSDKVEDTPTAPKMRRRHVISQQEEGSDNEAVDELIGNFTSEKLPVDGESADVEDEAVAAPQETTPQGHHDEEMEVDSAAERADLEATPQPAERSPGENGTQEPDSPEVPISVVQEAASSKSEGKRKASDADTLMLDAQRERKRPRDDSEPADEDEGHIAARTVDAPSHSRRKVGPRTRRRERTGGADGPVVSKRFQNVIGMLHSQISQHRYGNIFHNPIKKSEAPDYHDIVKRPMDLKTIKSRVKDGLISNSLEFQRDIYLTFANAMMYNRPGSEIYNMAEEMMFSSEREINTFRQTEGFHRM
ncbi:hypothetical protein BD413DRAFT_550035 [Trametes elegans]|nr:hypothetical protein BD413DRAFT_550035 [Trametes elegans]